MAKKPSKEELARKRVKKSVADPKKHNLKSLEEKIRARQALLDSL